ncbi:MAG: DedA family protein [Prevotella sp.]|nr:DedA family protein [Prevotella sp.]
MLLESTVIPVPSEFVVTPAAFNAADGTIDMWLVILFATIGADCGATINYIAGYYLGRPIIYRFANSKWGKMCLLNQEKVEHAEKYFDDHGAVATVTGRLIPGIRHLISIPAGLAKMNFWKFLLYTTLGAGAWNCILAGLGWYLHTFVNRDELAAYIELYSEYIKLGILVMVLLVIAYFCVKSFRKRHKRTK